MQKSLLALGVAMFLGSGAALAQQSITHPFHASQAKDAPNNVHMAVEIPAGSFTKYEINEEGLVFVDRFQSMPVVYIELKNLMFYNQSKMKELMA